MNLAMRAYSARCATCRASSSKPNSTCCARCCRTCATRSACSAAWKRAPPRNGRDPIEALDAFDALDGLAQGVLIVDGEAHVVFANRAAAALLAQPPGLRESRHGLQTPSSEATQRLHALIASAVHGDAPARTGGAMLIERTAPGTPLQVLVSPLGARRGTAMLMVIDPQAARHGIEQRLVALYALTPAEARVACEIGNGGNPRDIALALQVLPSTVRTHLHHVFAKTTTRGQADLMRLVAQLAQLAHARGD